MRGDLRPVFSDEAIRAAERRAVAVSLMMPLAAVVLGVAVAWLLGGSSPGWLARLAGAGVGLAALLATHDRLFLGGFNRRLRQDLEAKLRALGELDFRADDATVYYVGLGHPSRDQRLRAETDDDIGFLRLEFERLVYRGDRFSFEVPFEDLEAVELEPVGFGLPFGVKRLRLRFAGGEPFDEVCFCSREGDRLSRANRATLVLHEALASRWERSRGRLLASRQGADRSESQELFTTR